MSKAQKQSLADRIVGSRWHKWIMAFLRRQAEYAKQSRIRAEWDAGFFRYGTDILSRDACVAAMWIDAAKELIDAGAAEWDGIHMSPRGSAFLDQFKASGLKPTAEELHSAGAALQGKYGPIRITPNGIDIVNKMRAAT